MNKLQKSLLYPIVIVGIIMLITCLDWLLTAFFAVIFSTTMNNIACSPMVLLYVLSLFGMIYTIINCCQYIDEKY